MQHKIDLCMPSRLSNLCSSSVIPRVVTTRAWVSPRVKRADPCVLGKTPTSHLICLTSAKPLPSILFFSFNIAVLTISFLNILIVSLLDFL